MGLGLLTTTAGLAALGAVLSSAAHGGRSVSGGAVVAALPVRWDRFMAHAGSQSELFAEYQAPHPAVPTAAAQSGARSLACSAALGAGACFWCAESGQAKATPKQHEVSVAGGQGKARTSAADTLEQVLAAVSAVVGSAVSPNAALMEVGWPLCAPLL